jgi:hypothetical protein
MDMEHLGIVIALVAVVGAIALLVRGVLLGDPAPLVAGAILTRKEQAIVAACADAMFPAGGVIPLSGTEAGLVRYMDDYVRRAPSHLRPWIRLLLAFFEHAPWVFGPRRARFTRLTQAERLEALARMAKSPIYFRRVAFLSMRTILSMGYLADERVARHIGIRHDAAPFEAGGDAAPAGSTSPEAGCPEATGDAPAEGEGAEGEAPLGARGAAA